MNRILNFLFPAKTYCVSESWLLLALRVVFGILLMMHGLAKWSTYGNLAASFPDPLGFGRNASLVLAIFAEIICSAGFIAGAFYRLALIPMIFTMCIAFFVIHGGDTFAGRELPFLYLAVFVLMFITGPGAYALDRLIGPRLMIRKPPRD